MVRRAAWSIFYTAALGVTLAGCVPVDDDGADGSMTRSDAAATGADSGVTADSGVAPDSGPSADMGVAIDHPIVVQALGAIDVLDGQTDTPMSADGIPPYSMAVVDYTIVNRGDQPVVIDSVSVTAIAPAEEIEWSLNTPGTTSRNPFEITDETIAAGGRLSFGTFFFPLASGPRNATVTVTYAGGVEYSFTMMARGRDNADFSPDVQADLERIYGKRSSTSLMGGAVSDAAGQLYVAQNVNEWGDGFSENLALIRLSTDGSLAWAREWDEDFEQLQPDPGQNAESGGGADSIAYGAEGGIYLAGRRSQSNSNSVFQALAMRVASEDGQMQWAVGLTRGADARPTRANQSLTAYAVDASLADRVIITGQVADNSGVLLAALSKADGSMLWAYEIDLTPGSVDRGYAIAVVDGAAFVGGLTNGRGALLKVDGVDTAAPTFAWAKRVDMGVGSPINSLTADGAGGVLAALDVRGAATRFAAARFDAAGEVVWSKTWDDQNAGDNNNVYVVRRSGDQVHVGGRISLAPFDTQFGEGFVLNLGLVDGGYNWGAFYYTGKGTEEISEHRVKAIVPAAEGLWVVQQGFPGPNNADHYWGRWYQANDYTLEAPGGDGSARLADFAAPTTSIEASLTPLENGAAHAIDTADIWGEPVAEARLAAPSEVEGNNGRGHALIQHLSAP